MKLNSGNARKIVGLVGMLSKVAVWYWGGTWRIWKSSSDELIHSTLERRFAPQGRFVKGQGVTPRLEELLINSSSAQLVSMATAMTSQQLQAEWPLPPSGPRVAQSIS